MDEQDEVVEELKYLVRYYQQAAHEFFDDTSVELRERAEVLYGCLEKNENSLEEYRKMVGLLNNLESHLKQRVDDLGYLSARMTRLLKAP